jgi:hypothetical protein
MCSDNIAILFIVLFVIIFGVYINYFQFNNIKEGFVDDYERHLNRYKASISPPWVLNQELNPEIYKITKLLIKKINQKLTTNYQLGQFENVVKDKDVEGNKRYIIDFFVYQINHKNVNDVNRRLIADITVFKKTKDVQINTLNFSNAIKYTEPNSFKADPNNNLLILSSSMTGNNNKPMRFSFKEVLESSKFDNPTGIDLKDTNRSPWILPKAIEEKSHWKLRAFPCQDYGNWWDEDGIPLTFEQENGLKPSKKPSWCYNSYNSATEPQLIVAQKYPSQNKLISQRNKYDWMYDGMQGNIATQAIF